MQRDVRLRGVVETDLEPFFGHQVEAGPAGLDALQRDRFFARWQLFLADEHMVIRSILWGDELAGYVAHFPQMGKPGISYWIGRSFWGHGIAASALALFLPLIQTRPLYARVAPDNQRSIRILEKSGFALAGRERFFSEELDKTVEDLVFALS